METAMSRMSIPIVPDQPQGLDPGVVIRQLLAIVAWGVSIFTAMAVVGVWIVH